MLGLLMMQDMTVYELSKAFRQSLALFYSASLGSLQVAVKKLLARRLISCREAVDGGRRKKVYRILPAGKKAFRAGMTAAIPPTKLEVTALSRLSFLGVLDTSAEREQVLTLIVAAVREALAGLELLKGELDRQEVPAAWLEIYHWQVSTLDYGIMSHRAALEWFASMLGKATLP